MNYVVLIVMDGYGYDAVIVFYFILHFSWVYFTLLYSSQYNNNGYSFIKYKVKEIEILATTLWDLKTFTLDTERIYILK